MPTFTLTPDLRILNRYLSEATEEEFDKENPNYQPSTIANEIEWKVFNDEGAFEERFKVLLKEYQLLEHYDNLLYLTLYTFDLVWQRIKWAYDDYDSKKRAREIATLLLLLKQTAPGKLSGISFSSLLNTAKLTDTILNEWISKTLINAIEHKQFPVGVFGDTVLQMLTNDQHSLDPESANFEKLKFFASKRLINPKNQITKGKVTISLAVYNYLQGETHLKASEDTNFSDTQMIFLFDLLELLNQVDRLKIDSEPKDYMRTLIMNLI